jgi:hypothetical protein
MWTHLHEGIELAQHVQQALLLVCMAGEVHSHVAVHEESSTLLVTVGVGQAEDHGEAFTCTKRGASAHGESSLLKKRHLRGLAV